MFDPYRWLRPLLFALPPETAHRAALAALRSGLLRSPRTPVPASLRVSLFGLDFPGPVGMAAGFDKNGDAADGLLAAGLDYVESGTVTLRPQPGNPKPRVFRLSPDEAVINRMGFPGCGVEPFLQNLSRRRHPGIVGVNIGKNRDSADPTADYALLLEKVAPAADYVAVNVSSPNTPGLRGLQEKGPLDELLGALMAVRARVRSRRGVPPPLLVKVAPDLDDTGLNDIAELALKHGVDGLIATNTTVARPDALAGRHRTQQGGLSGRPLFARSTEVLAALYRKTAGRVPLIGVGGILSGDDAYAKVLAGASLVQVYTGFVYRGLSLVWEVHETVARRLAADGFGSIVEAVGRRVR
jgi:dihydroorotate dehydrogenase